MHTAIDSLLFIPQIGHFQCPATNIYIDRHCILFFAEIELSIHRSNLVKLRKMHLQWEFDYVSFFFSNAELIPIV